MVDDIDLLPEWHDLLDVVVPCIFILHSEGVIDGLFFLEEISDFLLIEVEGEGHILGLTLHVHVVAVLTIACMAVIVTGVVAAVRGLCILQEFDNIVDDHIVCVVFELPVDVVIVVWSLLEVPWIFVHSKDSETFAVGS